MANNRRLEWLVSINADTTQLQSAVQSAVVQLRNLGAQPQLTSNLQAASTAAMELERHLSNAFNVDTGKLDLKRLNDNLAKGGKTLQQYANQLISLGPEGEQAFLQVATAITKAELPLRRSNKLLNDLWITMKNTMRWQLTSSMLQGFVGSIETAYGYAKDLNESLNNIRIVTGKSTEDMARFAEQANKAAKALSTTTTSYTDASLIYYRQGLDDQKAQERANATIKYANVAGLSTTEAAEQLTAVWNNFDDDSKSLEYYIDVMTKLGATTASSSEEISTGMQKFAAVAKTVGLSYEYAASALATITAVTRQDADIVGTSLRTIFARLQSLKLGETLEEGTKLSDYTKALATIGVNVKEANGDLKDMDDILDELGSRWQNLTRDQKVATAQTVAGVRQYAQLMALMDNWDFMQKNLATSYGAEGELARQAKIYAESWEAARDRVRAAAEAIYHSIINEDFFIGFDNNLASILSGVATVTDAMGGLKGILITVSALMTQAYGDKMAQGMRNIATSLGFMAGEEQVRARLLQQEVASLLEERKYSQSEYRDTELGVLLDSLKVRQQANLEMDRLTEHQAESLKYELQELDVLEKQVSVYSQKADELSKSNKANRSIILNTRSTFNWDIPLEDISAGNQDRFIKMLGDKDIKTSQQAIQRLMTSLDNTLERFAKLDAISKAYANTSNEVTEELIQMAKELGLISEDSDAIKFFDDLDRQLKSGEISIEDFKKAIVGLGANEKVIQQYCDDFIELRKQAAAAGLSVEEFYKKQAEIADKLKQHSYAAKDWADTITSVGQAASSALMMMRALSNIKDVFTNENMSAGERFISILTSITMLIPSVIGLTNALTQARQAESTITAVSTAIKTNNYAVDGAGIVTTTALKIAKKMVTKATGEDTAVTDINTISHIANNAALAAGLITLLEIVAVAAVVAGAIWLIVKAYNADADAAKEAQKQAELLSETYKKAKADYEDLKKSIEDYDSSLKALDKLTKGSQEYADALAKANEEATALMERSPALAAAAYRDKNGAIQFRDNALESYRQVQLQQVYNAQSASLVGAQQSNSAKIKADNTALSRKIGYADEESGTWMQLSSSQLAEVLSKINKDNSFTLLEDDVKDIANINDELRASIMAHSKDLIELAKSNDQLTDANKFLAQEITHNYLTGHSDAYNKLSGAEQSAIDAISSNNQAGSLQSYLNKYNRMTDAQVQKLYAEAMGYSTTQIDNHNMPWNHWGTGTYYDYNGKVVADNVSDKIVREYLAKQDQEKDSNSEEKVNEYIGLIQKLEKEGNKLGKGVGDEFLGFVQKVDTGFDNLSSMTVQEIQSIRDNVDNAVKSLDFTADEWAKLGYTSAEEYSKAIKKGIMDWDPSAYVYALANKYASAAGSAMDALDMIQSGKLLKDTGATKLKEQFSSMQEQLGSEFADIYNFGILDDLGNQSLFDQASSITEVLTDIANPEKLAKAQEEVYNNTKKFYEDELKAAKDTKKEMEALQFSGMGAIDLGYLDEEIETWQKKLDNLEIDPIKIDIDFDDAQIKGMLTQLDVISQVAKLVDDNYQVSADNIKKLVETMPELLDDATINAQTGVLQLSQDTVNAFVDMADEMRLQNGDLLKDVLKQRVDEAQQELNLAQEVKEKSIDANGQITLDAIQNSGIEESERKRVATEIIKTKIKQRIDETQQSAQTLSDVTNDNQQMANSAAYYGEETAKQWTQAAEDTYNALHDAFANAAENQRQFIAGEPVTYNGIRSVTSSNYGVEKKDFNVIREKVENPYGDLLQWLNGEKTDTQKMIEQMEGEGEYWIANDMRRRMYQGMANQINDLTGLELTPGQLLNGTWADQVLAGGGDSKKAEELMDTLISKKVYELGNYTLDYSQYLADRNSINTAARGKANSSLSLKTVPDKFEDPFYRINKLLEYQESLIKDIDTQLERAYGTDRLNLFQKKLAGLQKQEELLREKQRIANDQREIKKNELLGLVPEFIIDEESGTLENYEEIMQQLTNERIAMYEAYNDQAQPGNKYTKYDKQVLDQMIKEADADFNKKSKAVEAYTKAVDEANDATFNLNENLRDQADIKLDEISYKLEIYLDVKDVKDKARQFAKTISESFGDALTHGAQSGQYGFEQSIADMKLIPVLQQQYADYKRLLDETDDAKSKQNIVEKMKEIQDQLISTGQALLDWADVLENMVPEAVSAAAERFSWFIDQLSHADTIADSIKELYALQGVTIKTAEGFRQLQAAAQVKVDNAIASSKLNRQMMEGIEPLLKNAEAEFKALNGDETNPEYDMRKKKYEAYLAEYNKYQEALYSSAQSAMQGMQEMYTQSIEKAMYDFDRAVSGGVGLDWLQERFERYTSQEERYYDAVNEAYQVQSWYNKIQADLDDKRLLTHKNELKELQEEINLRREGNTLSKYDMDILNAKYNLLQAQIALEEAQNAKNDMRLVRDRQGNWNYQYTANPDEIHKAQQAVLDAQNEYYNIAKAGYKDTVSQIISTKKEYEKALSDIYNDTTLSDEEQHQKRKELEAWFNEEMTQLYAELDVTAQDMRDAGKEAIDDFKDTYIEDLGNMAGTLTEFESSSDELIGNCNGYWDDYKGKVKEVAKELGVSAESDGTEALPALDKALQDIGNSASNMATAAGLAVDDMIGRLGDIDDLTEHWNNLAEAMKAVREAEGTSNDIVGDVASKLGFREDTNYSEIIQLINRAGTSSEYYGLLGELYNQRQRKRESSATYSKWADNDTLMDKIAGELGTGITEDEQKLLEDLLKQLRNEGYISFSTGGYTGEFSDAKLAFLHQKELVLNQDDTANLLTAVDALRVLPPSLFTSIEHMLDGNAQAAMVLMAEKMGGYGAVAAGGQTLEQHLTIEHVEFPNVSSADEIEKALIGLVNDAAQYTQIRKD